MTSEETLCMIQSADLAIRFSAVRFSTVNLLETV